MLGALTLCALARAERASTYNIGGYRGTSYVR